jgi:putative phosphoesterase
VYNGLNGRTFRVNRARRSAKTAKVIGLISDTHGLMRPEALVALKGVDAIIHAGDIGKPEVVGELRAIAPLVAIKGNNDTAAWAGSLPQTKSVTFGSTRVFVIHDVKELQFDPAARGYRVVVSGHSHKPSVSERAGVLFVNPGSAGPRRFKLPVAVAMLTISGSDLNARIVELVI